MAKQKLPKYIPKRWCFGYKDGKGCMVLRDTYCLYDTHCPFYKLKGTVKDESCRTE